MARGPADRRIGALVVNIPTLWFSARSLRWLIHFGMKEWSLCWAIDGANFDY